MAHDVERALSGPDNFFASDETPEPYYQDELVTIFHGDCVEILPVLRTKSFDLCLTDPPYNFGFDYGKHNDKMPEGEYARWCAKWWEWCRWTSKNVVVFPGHGNLAAWWMVQKPSAVGCWYKPGNFASSHIGFAEWEPWLYWGQRVGGSSVVRATVSKQKDTGDHPCPKPISLMRAMLMKWKPATVIDPFMGSGSTLKAAKELGIPCVGIEIEERFCRLAADRISQEVLDLGA